MESADFLVIGAGIAGASAGYELAKRGRVIVLEMESQPGYHTTGRSAALLTETYGNAVIRRLVKAARPFLEAPPEGFSDTPLVKPRGLLELAPEGEEESFAAFLAEAQALTPDIHKLDRKQAQELVPVLRDAAGAMAVYEPGAMDLDVHALHQGFLRGLRQAGGRVVTKAEVTAIQFAGGQWHCRTTAGNFAAPLLVNAAGAWADQLAGLAGLGPLGLQPKRRTVLIFDPPAGLESAHWPVTGTLSETWYFKPDAGRIFASPADATPVPPQDAQPEELDMAIGIERIEQATTFQVRRLVNKWAGLRTFAPDATPVVGPDPRAEGFFWLAGQGGYGIKTSPILARATASLLSDGTLPADLTALGVSAAALAPARLLAG